MASAAFWVALLSAFLILKWIADAGIALDGVRVQKERGARSERESEAAPELRKVA